MSQVTARKLPGPDHPITVTPTDGRVVVRAGDRVLADTTRALTLQESTYPAVQYVPLADVDPELIRPTPTTTHCPYKGDASYWSVTTGDAVLEDAVWGYQEPYDAVSEIAGHVAFYPNKVDISVEPA